MRWYRKAATWDLRSALDSMGGVLAFTDTETTGLQSRTPFSQVTQVASIMVDMKDGSILGKFEQASRLSEGVHKKIQEEKTHPPKGKTILDILKMNGHPAEDQSLGSEREMLEGLAKFLSRPGTTIVAHNATFDLRQINDAMARNGLPRVDLPVIDTFRFASVFLVPAMKAMASGNPEAQKALDALRDPKRRRRSLSQPSLGKALDERTEASHLAVNDAKQLAGITSKMVKLLKGWEGGMGQEFKDEQGWAMRKWRERGQRKDRLGDMWGRIKNLCERAGKRPTFGECSGVPGFDELYSAYQLEASRSESTPLGFASPEGGWASASRKKPVK